MGTTNKNNSTLTLSKKEMQDYGYRVVDAIVEHFETLNNKPPVALATRKEMDELLQEPVPEEGKDANEVLSFVVEQVLKQNNILSHPKAYAFVPGPSNYISVMADTLATGFNIFSGGWSMSPAASELELVTINWLLKLYGFPVKKGGGIFTSGGSMANLTALVTARRFKCGDDFSKAIIYLSDQAHSSNIKAIRICGFRKEQIRIIPTDMDFKLSLNKLKNAIAKDRLEGNKPFCMIASAGTTNTGTVDPLNDMAEICKNEDLWFHVDGAYGAAAILSKKGKLFLKGIERADSLTIDPHKWLYQPYEIGCLLVKNHSWLSATFQEKPEYLRDIEGNPSEINFYDFGMQLTRRFRALKFYMSVKTYGLGSFRKAIEYNLDLAEKTEGILRKSPYWEVISPATLAIINFRFNPIIPSLSEKQLDFINQGIVKKITKARKAILATTVLQEKVVLRMCLINPRTTLEDIEDTLKDCQDYAEDIITSL
ncbi:pyridoxal phosphate-dependent decarboxylase family protein [Maribacter hydrothermalis]|uniref:Decarboxylase n=1 Tax=Maribacter hydrothermalis TaxID=1836467 RepID=A0A1B7YY06_9FLAO|nr:aspartate aminotransferase family protein [Maribacter hydrothermalis]APQ19256.1 decarboxylase [Maribacter hydrothermalis]OBR35347.1 decarboxylase [Maribacter hydrothermalis]